MELLASGRDADVYAYRDGWVLRRYRDGRSAASEGALMRTLSERGYPVPAVASVDGPDLVMERVDGGTLGERVLDGSVSPADAGELLARLLDDLHAVSHADGTSLLHLDLHPLNVLMGPRSPVVIDWCNARPGSPGLDVAMSVLIACQVALTPGLMADQAAEVAAAVPGQLVALASALASATRSPWLEHVAEAERLRRRDPNLATAELDLLDQAVALARSLTP